MPEEYWVPGTCNVNSSIHKFDPGNDDFLDPVPPMPTWEAVVKSVAMAIIVLVAIMGNLLIIIIVILLKKMRTTTNIYIMNLAIADLMIACFPTWIYVVTEVKQNWEVPGFFCKFYSFVQLTSMCVISFTMMAVAGDRFFAIVFPLKSRVRQRNVKVVLVIAWIVGSVVGIPPVLYYQYYERQWIDFLEKFCSEVWPTRVVHGECDSGKLAEQTYWIVVVAILNWVPMLVMTLSYSVIIHRLQFGRDMNNVSESVPVVQRRSAKRVVRLMFILLITFIVCSVPFQVSTMYEILKDPVVNLPPWYDPVYWTAVTLWYAHSCLNPIVYGAMSKSFRSGFRNLLDRYTFLYSIVTMLLGELKGK